MARHVGELAHAGEAQQVGRRPRVAAALVELHEEAAALYTGGASAL